LFVFLFSTKTFDICFLVELATQAVCLSFLFALVASRSSKVLFYPITAQRMHTGRSTSSSGGFKSPADTARRPSSLIARPQSTTLAGSHRLPPSVMPNSIRPSDAILRLNEEYRNYMSGPSVGGGRRLKRASSALTLHSSSEGEGGGVVKSAELVLHECMTAVEQQRSELSAALLRATETVEQVREASSSHQAVAPTQQHPGLLRRASLTSSSFHRLPAAENKQHAEGSSAEQKLDECLHYAFKPTCATLPVFNAQLATTKVSYEKTYAAEVHQTLTAALATSQRSRRNVMEHAMDEIRGKKELLHHLKERVKSIESERHAERLQQYGDCNFQEINISRASTPAIRQRDHKAFVETHEDRLDQAWTLHDAIMERFQHEVEETALSTVPRGASRSRDRVWATVLSFILSCFTIHEFHAYHKRKAREEMEKRVAEEALREAEERQNRRLLRMRMIRGTIPTNALERMEPLVSTLKKLKFGPIIKEHLSSKRRVHVDRIRIALANFKKLSTVKYSVAFLLRTVRRLQRSLRVFFLTRIRRKDFLAIQFEHYFAERITYDRKTCMETERRSMGLDKKKSSVKNKKAAPPSPIKERSASFLADPSVALMMSGSGFQLSQSFAPNSNGGGPRSGSVGRLAPSLSTRYGSFSLGPQRRSIAITAELLEKRAAFRQLQTKLLPIALPHAVELAHGNGRLGRDIVSARLAALETHPLLGALDARVHARLPAKYRDAVLALVLSRERASFTYRMAEWRQAMAEARTQREWLVQIADLQQGRTHSPAQQELDAFVFPFKPIRRILVTPNDMRLLVLVAFGLAAQERRLATAASGGGIPTSLLGDTFPGLPEVVPGVDALDERNISHLIGHFHKVLNLPNISPHVLGNIWS
jgi:hypothetical protein